MLGWRLSELTVHHNEARGSALAWAHERLLRAERELDIRRLKGTFCQRGANK